MASRSIKCVAVGDAAVGKTSMIVSYTSDMSMFLNDYVPTVFDNFRVKMVVDGTTVNLDLWDTPGKEDYIRLRQLSYRGADVFVVAFSLVNRASYENVKEVLSELQYYAPSVPIVLVGSKLDLREDTQYLIDHPEIVPVTTQEGKKLSEQIGAICYIECSSKTQQNVKAVFDAAIREAIKPPTDQIGKKKKKEKKEKKKKKRLGWASEGGILVRKEPIMLQVIKLFRGDWKSS